MAVMVRRPLKEDARCQPGAYLSFDHHLYEAAYLKEQRQSSGFGMQVALLLKVVDCSSPLDELTHRWLNEQQIKAAELVRAAPLVEDTIGVTTSSSLDGW